MPHDELDPRVVAKLMFEPMSGCWLWTASLGTYGYGSVRFGGQSRGAHRFVYEALVGPVPDGLDLDHLCRNRACVNPDHLEPVTRRVNALRGAHPNVIVHRSGMCKRGLHPLTKNGDRQGCTPCRVAANRRRLARVA